MKILKRCIIGAALVLAIPTVATAQPDDRRAATAQSAPKKTTPNAGPKAPGTPYGRWDRSWGAQPPAPPKHWTKKGDWHRHVRTCQQKNRSYNARTDTYRANDGKARRCQL